MSNADDIFWRQFGIILAVLTLFGFVVAFIARDIAGDAHQVSMNNSSAVAARIAPVGADRVGDPNKVVAAEPKVSAAPAASTVATTGAQVDGEQLYNANCTACHASGVAGAPKKDDAAAWAPRIALGEDALLTSVTNGKGAMPPKAGNPSLTEEQIRATINYLIGNADSAAAAKPDTGAVAATKEAVAAAAETASGAVKDAAATATTPATTPAATAAVSGATATTIGTAASAPAAASDGKPGKDVYATGCVACHATGAANAPKLNDKAAWEPRVATGIAAMVQSVTKGKGAMPPRGGLSSLSDADIENAVRYMLKEAGVTAGG